MYGDQKRDSVLQAHAQLTHLAALPDRRVNLMIDDLYIVIPVHNRKHFTQECLRSLCRQAVRGFKIIVIDDGSTDGTRGMIEREFPDVHILSGDGNLWWTRATNLGVEYALSHGALYIMTLNDDTVATDDYIERMMLWAAKEPNAILGSVAVDAVTRKPIHGGEIVNWKMADYISLLSILTAEEQHGIHDVTHLPGRGMLIPAIVFKTIGLFDAYHFPQCMADFDFTHRAARAGYRLFCNYDAHLIIYENSVTTLHFRRNKNFKNYWYHLFGLKSGSNLVKFFFYAMRNCPITCLMLFLSIGFCRRIFGYLFEWTDEVLHISLFKKFRLYHQKSTHQSNITRQKNFHSH
jgi:GT2 family glycosyltransferase